MKKVKEKIEKRRSTRQLKAMLRKNWLLKIRHPFVTCAEILLPTVVMLLLIAVRLRVDTRVHPPEAYIRKDMLVEVGKSEKSAPFEQILELLCAKGEYLAFAPDTNETRMMINLLSVKFPLLKMAAKVFHDEEELEAYIHSDAYGAYDKVKNCTNPRIKGAIVFHSQGPRLFDYSIRLNHTWAFSGFPDVKSIMDVNGPFLNDLELGVNIIPIMQYSFSGFLTLQQVMDSFIIFASQQQMTNSDTKELQSLSDSTSSLTQLELPWMQFSPSNIRLAPFPTREYTDDEFQSIVKSVMGVLYLLGFLYPISRLISYSVLEKELKIKEGLYMMGLRDNMFHLSWFLTYALQFAISSLIITLCTMGTLFKYSDKTLVFVYFFCFGLSSITLSFLISTFFTRAKTAVAVGTLAFLAAFFPYYSVDEETVSTLFKVLASLLSPTAFALGSINFADYERAHVGLRWSNIWRDSSGVCFLICLLMILLDTFLYGAIGLYLDKVLNKENDGGFTWSFTLFKSFWKKKKTNEKFSSSSLVKLIDSEYEENPRLSERGPYKPAVEAISFEMKQQELDGRCIQLRNLHKMYASKKARCCAVDSLQLTLYENQILALLGHNGAGKSTTMSMLVGLVRPTSGDAVVFGKNILTDMDEIRQSLGVCPQYDILFPELTVKEHLEIFANIKGVNEDCLENAVIEMAEEVGLADKLNSLVGALSGGMRRKLSLGIALIGNSKVIVLDEPTSGMDPYSMRLTWQLIKRIRKGRIILLTTHSMDEADALGDRIAIMANGSLKCCGRNKKLIHDMNLHSVRKEVKEKLNTIKPHPDQESVTFTTSHFNPLLTGGGGGGPIPFDLSLPIAKEVSEHVHGGWIQRYRETTYEFPDSRKALSDAIEAAGPTLGPTLLAMSQYLMSSYNESYQSRYGAVVMDKQGEDGSLGYTILHNSSCQHAAPTFINLMNSALLRFATRNENMTILTHNHPLPMTKSQLQQRHEREVKAKHQQLISGVSILSYWASTYFWDFISFLFSTSFAIVLFFIFGLDQFIGRDSLFSTVLMFLGYGLSIASSTYCLTFFFSEHSMAQNVVLLVHFFTGLILMVISFIMGLLESTRKANSLLKNFFRLSPGFCFADGLASLALLRQGMKKGSGDSVFDWNVTGASICYLAAEGMIYFLVTLALEFLLPYKINFARFFNFWRSECKKLYHPLSSSSLEPLISTSSRNADLEEDIDVQAERDRVISGGVGSAILYLNNLRKVFPGGKHIGSKVAVQSLTFSVQEGECFGFLGTNGAGKTTTLSMLSGEEHPSDGTAYIFGKDIKSNPKAARQHIGYCPQFDALLEYLTVREHLELYARIKGVQEYQLEHVVMEKLVEFDLLKHADKPSYALSGGNKRKLSVAIAMIGDPPLVILDEPSTGMDPIAKRFMWEVISRLSTRRGKTAVILTTHSMNEAQALCTRIGIMVGGKLRCIGSPQHLKNRFGNHLELEVKPNEVSLLDLEAMCETIQERFFEIPRQPRSILNDLEICIGGSTSAEKAVEINLSSEILFTIGRWLGSEERVENLLSSTTDCGAFGEKLSEQLIRDGGIQLPVFAEWWLTEEKFAAIHSFIQSSFPGATYQGCDGLSVKYQLPYSEDLSLADVFGHMERNRNALGISEYSISQSTLETIFNHFATCS
ncbi:ABC transporter A family member 1 [Striga hermonthica]|uniref:ABC transporter A family member 1 n=1 Tax=Striga hermonthica TaxID=68872 RepID=A0A9N7NKT7_STRHE|nr:ABC transporter A family member 1 [Striga hermonthica]